MVISESLKGYVYEANEMEKSSVDGVKRPKYLCCEKLRTKQKTLISCEKRVR